MTSTLSNPFTPDHLPRAGKPVDYWVDLPDSAAAAAQVDAFLAGDNPHSLSERGRFVLVSGAERTGKSTLIRHCVANLNSWREGHLMIVDLSDFDPRPTNDDGIGVTERTSRIYKELVGYVWPRIDLPDEQRDHLLNLSSDEGYSLLSGLLEQRQRKSTEEELFMVVLLPPTKDFSAELASYASFARQSRLVFLGETSRDPQRDTWERQLRNARHCLHVHLKPLDEVGYQKYVDHRITPDQDGRRFPNIPPTTLPAVASDKKMSIDQFRLLLGLIVRERMSGSTPFTEVTMDDFRNQAWLHSRRITDDAEPDA